MRVSVIYNSDIRKVNKRKSMVKINPKSTIEIFNKAIEICRDLATFISTCGQKELSEKKKKKNSDITKHETRLAMLPGYSRA